MLLAMAKVMIDANTIDEPFLVEFTNAPQLVDEAGIILKDKDKKTPLVWDTVTSSAKPYVEGVKPALKGSYTVDGKPMRTAFQVLSDSIKDITPQYAEEVAGIPAATVTRLAQTFAKEARIGETIEIDGLKLRYRPRCCTRSAACRPRSTASRVGAPASSSTCWSATSTRSAG